MKRNSKYSKTKLASVASKSTILDVHADSFGIEKVHLHATEFENPENHCNFYLDFQTISLLAAKCINLRLTDEQIFTGTVKDGQVISRKLSISKKDQKVWMNLSEGPGKQTATGAIIPAGKPVRSVAVPMTWDAFCSMILVTHDYMQAYMVYTIKNIAVRDVE